MDIVTYALCKKMASGSKGEKGDPGEKGEQGLPGRDGADGVTPNLQVGDVVTLEAGQQASITRRGNDENPIFDFAIPKGDTGKDGIFVGRVDDAPDHAQVVVNDDASPYDLFFENANVSYMGDTYTSLKEKADADIEYLLREIQTQHYEGQRITATNTYQKQVRSAILKGQTLVNLVNDENKVYTLNVDGTYKLIHINLHTTLEANKKYYLSYRVVTNTILEGSFGLFATNGSNHCGLHSPTKINETGVVIQVGVVNKMADKIRVFAEPNCVSGVFEVTDIVLMEYQDGMENWDIPYFEGIQSVKMPVLTTVGKNLFDGKLEVGHVGSNGTLIPNTNGKAYRSINFIELNDSETFVASYNELIYTLLLIGYDAPYNENGKSNGWNNNKISDKKYAKIEIRKKDGSNFTSDELQNIKIQIEQGSVATSYEPFKSNILSTPEDIELGSVGDVKDELDLVTGELAQRTDIRPYKEGDESNSEVLTDMTNTRYKLPKEVIKTVDLNNQKVYSYDGTTHYTCSSEEGSLVPTLSIDVPTNLPALVSRQRDTIKDLEKENEALKEEVTIVDQQRESGDLELLSSDFDLDFRLMEIEFALDIPIAATFKEVRNMVRTPYEMAKILILGGKYERSDMEYKLGKYLERKQITQAQYDELIALMEANELVV